MHFKITILAAAIFALMSGAAYAGPHDRHDRGWHRGHDRHHYKHKHQRHHYHQPRSSFSLYIGSSPSWYRPAPYYERTQVIYSQPVIVPQPVVQHTALDDRYCREYQTTGRVGGRLQPGYGTACYQPDGSWQIVSY